CHEIVYRAACVHRAGSNGVDGCQHILDAVVELSIQDVLMFLRTFAVRNIAGDAEQAHGSTLLISDDRGVHGDPAHLSGIKVIKLVLHHVFSIPRAFRAGCLPHSIVYPHEVIAMDETTWLLDCRWRCVVPMDHGRAHITLELAGA